MPPTSKNKKMATPQTPKKKGKSSSRRKQPLPDLAQTDTEVPRTDDEEAPSVKMPVCI